MSFDVLVLGAGPAALALALALRARRRDAVVLAPDPDRPWTNRYAAWDDEAALPGERFAEVAVDLGDGAVLVPRAYTVVDRPALRSRYAAVPAIAATAREVWPDRVVTDHGEVRARLVVDATGAGTRFLRRTGVATHFQTAYGAVVRPDAPIAPTWMDFSRASGPRPTFLYAFPRTDGTAFVEETSLAAAGGVPLDALAARLRARFPGPHADVERCVIPLDLPLPDLDQPILGFGAAASLVHPATGFQVARALALAPAVAEAVDAAWGADPARAAWRTIWPADRVARHRLYTFGMRALASLDADDTRAFLRRFFDLGLETWASWLSDRLGTPALLWAMTRFYTSLELRLAARVPLAGVGW